MHSILFFYRKLKKREKRRKRHKNQLKFVESINEVPDLIIDVGDQLLDLPLGVEDLDRLSVGIVADSKWPGNSGREVTET